jgi:hypothetical protein
MNAFLLITLLALGDQPGSLSLFNGKDLDGWVAEGASTLERDGRTVPVWTVKDGNILCTGKGFGFLRYTRREFADFVLHAEFRMAPRCNSGLGIRTGPFDPDRSRATRPSFYSYEIQLFDDAGKPPSLHSTGSLYRYVAPRANPIRPAGEWNRIEIQCVGPKIGVSLNGERLIDVDQDADPRLRDKPRKGFICLQNHGGTIEFRSLGVEEIGP